MGAPERLGYTRCMIGHWSHRAVEDLLTKVSDRDARKYLMKVSRSSLHRHCPQWGGAVPGLRGDRLWRRGVAVEDETLSSDQLSEAQHVARSCTLVYFHSARDACYLILGLLTEGELIGGSPWFRQAS